MDTCSAKTCACHIPVLDSNRMNFVTPAAALALASDPRGLPPVSLESLSRSMWVMYFRFAFSVPAKILRKSVASNWFEWRLSLIGSPLVPGSHVPS